MFISLCMAMGNRHGNSRRLEGADRDMPTILLNVAAIPPSAEADSHLELSGDALSESASNGTIEAAADGLPDLFSSIIANTEFLEKIYGENHNLNNIRRAADEAKRQLKDVETDEDMG